MSRLSVAVVGAGISGLTAAYILQERFDVTLFEANGRLGGNAETVTVDDDLAVDLGFTGYSTVAYPALSRLFQELGVEGQPVVSASDALCQDCRFADRNGTTLAGGELGKLEDATEEARQAFTADRQRFTKELAELAAMDDTDVTVGAFLTRQGYSPYFIRHWFYPRFGPWFLLGAAELDQMPVSYLASSMAPLLSPAAMDSWYTVKGGSRTYTARIAERLPDVRLSTPVRSIRRIGEGVTIRTAHDGGGHFDKAVLAVHPRQALRMLDVTDAERAALGAFRFVMVDVVLHTDTSVLPAPDCTGALIMHVTCQDPSPEFANCHVDVTKSLRLNTRVRYVKSFNPTDAIDPTRVVARRRYEVPLFTAESVRAQGALGALFTDRLAFAGSWFGNGFHEAGCLAGLRAAAALGASWGQAG
ncbi:FAD-dependent oxidoreductase [Streptomyces sp. 7N604]|uniref:FAD-dependent oxidoreductase n=1 Tax=Streptomyces sp. 7N604 TaxID=3457415 RepID=UPI003FD4F65A